MEISKVTQGGVPSFPSDGMGRPVSVKTEPVKGTKSVEADKAIPDYPLTKEEAEKAVQGLNEIISASNSHLKFQFHEKLNQYYVSIVDNNTNEVVREIPPKKLLDLVASIWEQIGIIVDRKV